MARFTLQSISHTIAIVFAICLLNGSVLANKAYHFKDTARIKVFILAGQSNAVGYNDFKEYTGDSNKLLEYVHGLSHVRFWPGSNALKGFQNTWTPLQFGASDISSHEPFAQSFGPEIGLAITLSNALPGEQIAIIKYAVGGTGIARSEDYTDYIPALEGFDDKGVNWHPSSDGKQAGMLYTTLIDNINQAFSGLINEKRQYEICGFFWMQGEHEAGISKRMAEDYGSLLSDFRKAVRKDLNSKKLPFIVGEINAHTWLFADIARSKQKKACSSDKHSVLINTTDLKRGGNGGEAHFTSDAMIELGKRFGTGILQFFRKR